MPPSCSCGCSWESATRLPGSVRRSVASRPHGTPRIRPHPRAGRRSPPRWHPSGATTPRPPSFCRQAHRSVSRSGWRSPSLPSWLTWPLGVRTAGGPTPRSSRASCPPPWWRTSYSSRPGASPATTSSPADAAAPDALWRGHQGVETSQGQLHVPAGLLRVDASEPQESSLVIGGDVPALPHQGAVAAWLELVAPDPTRHIRFELALRAGLPSDPAVLLELDHRAHCRIADTQLHPHAKCHPERKPLVVRFGRSLQHPRTVDERVFRRVSKDVKNDLWRGADEALDREHVVLHLRLPAARRS